MQFWLAGPLAISLLLACCSGVGAAVDPCSVQYPELGADFVTSQAKTVALTFDDAPDPTNTAQVLDALRDAGLHATFFVNTHNQMDVANSAEGQALLRRIADEGHTVGSHTVDHISLDDLSTTRIEYELGGLESELDSLGIATPKLFRPPHGTPFIHNTADVPRVASVVRRHAVTVLWTFAGTTTLDWDCGNSVSCVLDNYESFFSSSSSSGIPLMHAVVGGTAGALPQLLAAGKVAGINFVSVDDFVYEKYGMSAADVVSRVNSNCPNIYSGDSTSTSSGSNGSSSSGGGGRRAGPGNPAGPGGPGDGGPGGPGGGGPPGTD